MLLARLSVSSRFLLVLLIGFIFQAGISLVSLITLKESLLQARTNEVKHLLDVAYSAVAYYHGQYKKGVLTEEQAKKAAIDDVRAMRYDGSNYFFIWTMEGVGVSHGSHPEWEGHNVLQSPDREKLPVVSHMVAMLIDACNTPAKEGVATYTISKPGKDTTPIGKIAYTKLFEPWGWSVGTGAYIDDIDKTFHEKTLSLLWVFALMMAVAGFFTYTLGRDLSRSLTRLSFTVARVAKGELDGEVPEVQRRDEVGVMARALLVLRDHSREATELRLDQLTGLPSRKLLMDRLYQAMAAGSRNKNHGALMLIDMDKFKTLNDTHGHDIGDLLLREVAVRLKACVREGDTVARLGGDEFVVVVVDLGQQEEEAGAVAEIMGERVLNALSHPFNLGSIHHITSASVGISMFQGDSVSAEELLKQADMAMYKSKDTGRNTCRFFDPYMEATVRERAMLEKDLRVAIDERQFLLYYQPKIGPGNVLEGAEALLRWNHPSHKVVVPDTFIPLAEETGMIQPLGLWVLETACNQLAVWAARPEMAELTLAVNVSSRQFQRPEFVEQLEAVLERTGANPHLLELELTESLLVDNVDDIIEKMLLLKARGVRFSLDDFGTGYSSLAYLKRMPLNQVKIDRSFVRDVLSDPNAAAIAKTVMALAATLGLGVVAEGVETLEQREFLLQAGCTTHQGFYYSRALPLETFEELIHNPTALDPLLQKFVRKDHPSGQITRNWHLKSDVKV